MSSIHLDAREQRQLVRAQEALLSPLVSPDAETWQLGANEAVRDFVGADHSVFSIPTRTDVLPPAVTDDTDPAFPDRLFEYIEVTEAPNYSLADPYVDLAIQKRLRGGPNGYHMDHLVPPEQQARSAAIHDVFVPSGMVGMMGLSLPLPEGPEATQFFGFKRRDAPGYDERGLRKLRLLVPAFVAGVRTYRRWVDRPRRIAARLDVLTQPVALFDAGGRLLHRNRAYGALLADEPEAERVTKAMDRLVQSFIVRRSTPKSARREVPATVDRRLRTRTATYRLWGSLAPAELDGRKWILVQLEREAPRLPEPEALEESHGLTARQAEVALLLARGYSDKAVARRLDISWHTARTHARNVLEALDLSSRAEVALALLQPPAAAGD